LSAANNVNLFILQYFSKPLEVRESKQKLDELVKFEKLGFWHQEPTQARKLIELTSALELGRIVTRDIAGSDPERMTPANIQDYVTALFKSTDIKVQSIRFILYKKKHI
jgi:leucyl aminopeptidase